MTLSKTVLLMGLGLAAAGCWKSAAQGGAGGITGGTGGAIGAAGADAGIDVALGDTAPDVPQTPLFPATYHMGADITWVQHDEYFGATYLDTDGTPKDILVLLKNHGFNSVRLRAYVDPRAADGYDQFAGFGDTAHTVTMGGRIRAAGMGFYLALHYSDNWADPGKQCVPVAWQGAASIDALATYVHDYTAGLLGMLKAAGATPDFVQVGNEITSGMLNNICDATGMPTGNNPINGSITNWGNLATLLKAGIAAVKEVDPRIKTVLHIDKARDLAYSAGFISSALAQGVPFDVFADSAYVYWHGQPSGWQNTFTMLAQMFPSISFVIPEYGNETATSPVLTSTIPFVNDLIYNLPNGRGLGAWIYEPEHPFQAGPFAGMSLGIGLFDGMHDDAGAEIGDSWPAFPAMPAAMSLYDTMRTTYAGRLQ